MSGVVDFISESRVRTLDGEFGRVDAPAPPLSGLASIFFLNLP